MAASTGVGPSSRSGCRRRMARGKRGGGHGPGSGGVGPLKRLKLAVEEFVQATSQGEAAGGREEPLAERHARSGRRKSRKDFRKEKRQLRKARRLQTTAGPAQTTAGPAQGRGGGTGATSGPRAEGASGRGGGPSSPPSRTPPPPQPSAHAARIRALLAANQEEDREIRKLERCLGLNKRRKKKDDTSSVPLSFARDGLDYILGALGSGGRSGLCDSSSEDGEDGYAAHESDPNSDIGEQSEGDSDAKEESHADSDAEDHQQEEQEEKRKKAVAEGRAKEKWGEKKVRFAEDEERSENSPEDVGAADQSPCEDGIRYIPPHIRRAEETVDAQKREDRERLRRHVQGLINRLSELNMASISRQLEELYRAHSRKDMNDTLTGVLLSACAPGMSMPSRLVMEHILLVGAHFLEAVVRKFDAVYTQGREGKECDNLFTIIAHLYNFHVVQCLLIFDVLKKLIVTFTEKDIELILLMLRNVGFSLRKDDALSLKELITETQAKASRAGSRFQDQTRIRFMLETMLALKNNDMRKIPGYDPEPVEKLRKLQRTLVRGTGSGAETQLRVSWDGILNAEQTGRWWIVGSAWSGTPMISISQQKSLQKPLAGTVSVKMLELARKQRMNTDVRRNIFCTIMTSEDFLDAFEKLLKLGLKDQQEREIVHVLMDCCLQERTYNPFYAFLAGKFCDFEKRFQMTFQFSIWDKFRDLENLPTPNFSNLVHLVAHLLKTKSLPLSILKVVEFSELDKPRIHFLRKVLSILLMETEVEDLSLIFTRVSDNPKLGILREGLKLFISHFLLKSAQTHHSAEEASVLRERAELTARALQGRASLRM
ncbi:nucleolar MIF4G domain-containing protein 1 isoform 2-T2 [Rhynchonycteris naso]